jgi:hypothetical protein
LFEKMQTSATISMASAIMPFSQYRWHDNCFYLGKFQRLRQWVSAITIDSVQDKVLKLCDKAPQFKKAVSHPQAYRTSNALD